MMEIENNNFAEAKLNGSHLVKVYYENSSYRLEVLNGKNGVPILVRESAKDILQNESIKRQIVDFLYDNEIVENKKEAKIYLNKIYAQLTPKLVRIKKNIDKAIKDVNKMQGYVEEEGPEQFVFDSDSVKKRLHSGVGIFPVKQGSKDNVEIVDRYYFGFNIEKKVPQFTESGKFVRHVQAQKLCIVFDDHSMQEAEDLQEDHNVEFTGELIQETYRWRLEAIKKFLDHQGMERAYPIPTLRDQFQRLKKKYQEYNYFHDDRYYDLFPLWDIGTYFFPLFDCYPYVSLESVLPGSGKTKTMALSSQVTFNAMMLVNMTPSSLFRIVDSTKATLYVDEAEHLYSRAGKSGEDDATDVVSLLNAGWQKGAKVPRQEKAESGKWKTVFFDSYSPKMIASLNGVRGPLESRSIHCAMLKTTEDDPRGDLWPDENDSELKMIRNAMYPVAFRNWKQVSFYYGKGSDAEVKKEFKISNRDWQIWKPLLVIAKIIDESDKEKKSEVYKRLGGFAEEICRNAEVEGTNEDSWQYKLLETVVEMAPEEEEWIAVKRIREQLVTKFGETEKKPRSEWIGRNFKKFALHKRMVRTGKEYLISKKIVADLCSRARLPSLASQLSQPSPEKDLNDGKIEVEEEVIQPTLLPCDICGQTEEPCAFINKKNGKPICNDCKEGLNQNGLQ